MTLEERVARLEELFERIHHEHELCSIYVPRLAKNHIKLLEFLHKLYYTNLRDWKTLRDILKMVDGDLQEHFKSHSERKLYDKKKPKDII